MLQWFRIIAKNTVPQSFRVLLTLVLIFVASLGVSGCSILPDKTKAGLQVVTPDVPASLFLDGQYLDKTPFINKEIKPGTYTLRIQPDNPSLVPQDTTITLQKGVLSVVIWKPGTRPELSSGVMYEMEKLPTNKGAELALVSIPDGAIVSLDTRPKNFSPVTVSDIEPGHHEFEVSLPSYETQKHTVNVVEGYRIHISIKLAKSTVTGESADNEELTDAALASPSAVATKTATGSAAVSSSSAKKTAPTSGTATIKPTGFLHDGVESLRVRSASSSAATEVGFVPVGKSYPVLSQGSGWVKISFDSLEGWVSQQYVTINP